MQTTEARPSTPARRLPYVGALDGLRAVSLMAVMLYHGTFESFGGGFLGVSTFFTLSGFLITSLLLAELRSGGRIDLGRFWSARARRLLPAAGITLVIVVGFARLAASSTQLTGLRQDLWASFGLVINWRLALSGRAYGGYTSNTSPVQHLWSLAIEEQFYLLLPFLIMGAAAMARRWGLSVRRTVGVGALVLGLASTAFRWTSGSLDGDVTWAYYATHTRAAELFAGVLLACAGHRLLRARHGVATVQVLGVLGALVTLAAWVGAEQTSPFLYGPGLTIYSLASAAVIASCLVPSPVRTALDTAPLRALGLVSYGAYLYHWPIFSWLDEDTVGVDGIALFALQVAVTLAVATLSYHYVEMPIRRRRLLPRVPPPALAGAVLTALTLTLLVPYQTTDTGPSGVEVATGERVAPVSVSRSPTSSPAAVDPAAPQVERLLLVGDSIPQQLAPYVAGTLPEVEVRWVGRAGIGPLTDQGVIVSQVEQAVADFDPDVVVVHFAGSYLEYQSGAEPFLGPDGTEVGEDTPEMFEAWSRESQRLVKTASARGATVLWALIPVIDPDNWFGYLAETAEQLNSDYLRLDGVTHLDWWSPTLSPERTYSEAMTDSDGTTDRGRAEDGLHFTAFGNEILAATIADALDDWPGRSSPAG